MSVKFVFLWTDVVLWLLVPGLVAYVVYVRRTEALARKWRAVLNNKTAVTAAAVLSVFFVIALTDSVHYRRALPAAGETSVAAWDTKTVSLLDALVGEQIAARERSYSAPFALFDFDKTTVTTEAGPERVHARLKGAGAGVDETKPWQSLFRKIEMGVMTGAVAVLLAWLLIAAVAAVVRHRQFRISLLTVTARDNPWRPAILVWLLTLFLGCVLAFVWPVWHPFGTDATGNDVFYSALKSIRTAFAIGLLATFSTLPFAVTLGIAAGYFKGWVDDVIQYVYTTISSIPSVLLIAASVLMIQVFIDKHPEMYATGLERADVRLFLLALIIGLTSWAGLARLLRAETMKVSAMDFVTAARAFGVSPFRIMARHVFPNVAHIVLIVAVLDFSGIVLYEAVLSYVGVGVDPVTDSFGSMINAAASEMSRSPVIWWNLAASFVFMVTLVLSANLFASGVRDAFDPRSAARLA